MIEFYEIGVITITISLFCLGLREITDDVDGGRIGYPIRKWFVTGLEKGWMSEYIAKPIILCCSCMASFWGIIIFWISYLFVLENPITWMTIFDNIVCCVVASFINTIGWMYRQNLMLGLKNYGKDAS